MQKNNENSDHSKITIQDILQGKNIGKYIYLKKQSKGITSLKGIESYTTLEECNFSDNLISDLTPLSNLTLLKDLDLSKNHIKDLSPLVNLTGLKRLILDENQIESIWPLKNLKNLEFLSLKKNKIAHVEEIEELSKLIYLNLERNQISNMKDIPLMKKLEILNLGSNQIQSIENMYPYPKLRIFNIYDNSLHSLEGIQKISDLEWLNVSRCQISALTPLSVFSKLKGINLDQNKISDLRPLKHLQSIERLNLSNNLITDITPIIDLCDLRELKLHNNILSSLQFLDHIFHRNPEMHLHITKNPLKSLIGITIPLFNDYWLAIGPSENFSHQFPSYIAQCLIEYEQILMEDEIDPRSRFRKVDDPLYKEEEREIIIKKIQKFYEKSLQTLINSLLSGEHLTLNELDRIVYEAPLSMRTHLEINLPKNHPLFNHSKWNRVIMTEGEKIFQQ